MSQSKYKFIDINECNMCGNKTQYNKLIGHRLNQSQGFKPKSKSGISVSVYSCTKCSLVYSNPQPIPINIQDHYGVPPEEYWNDEYFVTNPNYFAYQINKAKEYISYKDGMSALDIGAGLGKCMISLKNAGFDTYGIEPSVTFREKAISKMGIDENKITLGMLEEINFPNESFDFITFGAVLEHLYDPNGSLDKALQWLKPNGVIHFEVPSSNWFIAKLYNLYFKIIGTCYVTNLSPMHEPYHMYEFDVKSFEYLSSKLGFEILETEHSVCDIYHFPNILHPLLKGYMKHTNKGMQLTVWIKRNNK